MVPSYARIQGMDSAASQYASKYSLYLYREVGKDSVPANHYEQTEDMSFLNGIPVLFIPGNAGSYKQVRSIAAETSNLFFGDDDTREQDIDNPHMKNFDFFAADFNEDFTAFHGQTMMEQANFLNEAVKLILSLYADKPNPPTSVVIIGHSMGGIVARAMLALPNYVEESVNTIITLASPHAAAPLTFDADVVKMYSLVDKFWYEGFQNISQIAYSRLANLSLISITGGGLDATLPADYTAIGHLVPLSNGFTVYTTGIPSIWSPVDHLAIVWCGQLRRVIAKSLLEIADISSPSRVYPLEKRMNVFRKNYLSGFENYALQDSIAFASSVNTIQSEFHNLKIDTQLLNSYSLDKESHMKLTKDNVGKKFNLFTIPPTSNISFSLLTSLKFASINDTKSDPRSLLLCANKDILRDKLISTLDFTNSGSDKYASLYCSDISKDLHAVPRSDSVQVQLLADSSFLGNQSPFYGIHLDSSILSKFDSILVVNTPGDLRKDENAFVIGETSLQENTVDTLGNSELISLLFRGADVSLPSNRPLMFSIQIPSAWSSLLAYKISLHFTNDDKHSKVGIFSPFIRQWSDDPYESKWHINIGDKSTLTLFCHNIAPFIPFKVDKKNKGLNLQLWSDNDISNGPLDVNLSIDYIMSLRLLVLRYRLTVVSFCVMTCLLVILRQFIYFRHFKMFPNFQTGLQLITSPLMFVISVVVLANLSWLVKIPLINQILSLLDPVTFRDRELSSFMYENGYQWNKLYMGLEEDSLFLIPVIFYCISIFIVFLTYKVISLLLFIFGACVRGFYKATGVYAQKREAHGTPVDAENKTPKDLDKEASSLSPTSLSPTSSSSFLLRIPGRSIKMHRLLIALALVTLVAFYVPFQVITVICCFAQGINCLKLYGIIKTKGDSSSRDGQQLLNFQVSILALMLWVMPIDIPIVIVHIHNLAINWRTAFSSHHNILSVLPIMLFLERNEYLTTEIAKGGKLNLEWINCSFRKWHSELKPDIHL
ncbi:GPI inositol deacylase [Scheffersomyces spartinae]|uniref:GPI inositol-deacylase n=1 Tax=Scheffersomyces spartinae TaxID=45513 RepID=A0A9P7V8E4_9ASCO|nr:GPI inositol deacylase [Scheffersomyces spartinae]KAG7193068.1 GPI inositol deacylase [Scheffersomyces spartinae]